MILGALQVQPMTTSPAAARDSPRLTTVSTFAGYDSENITVTLLNPANQSRLVGTVNITLNITSLYGDLNLTLFIDGEIYSVNSVAPYNQTLISPGVRNITVDTTVLAEGNLNFTFFFENRSLTTPDLETYHLVFLVDNHGAPNVNMIYPTTDDVITGLTNLTLNITADYPQVYINISVNEEIVPEYNGTLVGVGLANYTINGSKYENGNNVIDVVVWTEEGLTDSVSRTVNFLDYIRFTITGLTHYSEISGVVDIDLKLFTPYNVTKFSVFVDDETTPLINNVTVDVDSSVISLDTTGLSEGEHNFTFIGYDEYGHSWTTTILLVVNNHGAPSVAFTAPSEDIVTGSTQFTVEIESTWDQVTVTVYVDDEAVESLTNVTVSPGLFNFTIDVGAYSKWQHTVKVVVTTPEGLEAEITRDFGFASIRIEEIVSGIILLGAALSIPLLRLKQRKPVRKMLLVDLLFFVVVAALFYLMGVTTLSLAIWHFNLASIWAVGITFVFTNWVFHLLLEEEALSE